MRKKHKTYYNAQFYNTKFDSFSDKKRYGKFNGKTKKTRFDENTQKIKISQKRITWNGVFILKILWILGIVILIIFLLNFNYLTIYFTRNDKKYEVLLFTILVSCMAYMFLLVIGFDFRFSKNWIKIIIIFISIYLIYLGFRQIGYGIIIHYKFPILRDILTNRKFESNTYKGILFMIENIIIFSAIWFIHLIFEHETTN